MNPAFEYILRNDILKELLPIPCSLFLFHNYDLKCMVMTISEEFKANNCYSVKHWHLNRCNSEIALPPISEFHVQKSKIFTDEAVILPSYNLIKYQIDEIPHHENSHREPMSSELYSLYFLNTLKGSKHQIFRNTWLWNQFIKIYIPNFNQNAYNSKYNTHKDQIKIVSEIYKREWKIWQVWKKFMMLNSAELFFFKHYSKKLL